MKRDLPNIKQAATHLIMPFGHYFVVLTKVAMKCQVTDIDADPTHIIHTALFMNFNRKY